MLMEIHPGLLVLAFIAISGCSDDNPGTNANNNNAIASVCGNGQQEGTEECDQGSENSDLIPNFCRTNCLRPSCGDGVVDEGEDCDEANQNSDQTPDACRSDCRSASCGDGVADSGESCDGTDAGGLTCVDLGYESSAPVVCDTSCEPVSEECPTTCGDGVVEGDEECDDENTTAGDGCSATCAVEARWECDGQPSQCECVSFFSGPGCEACTVFVHAWGGSGDGQSWATATTDPRIAVQIAAVLTNTWSGVICEIWITEGVYQLYGGANDPVMPASRTHLHGGFDGTETERSQRDWASQPTVFDGQSPSTTWHNLYQVVKIDGVSNVVVDGLSIRGGNASGDWQQQLDHGGGLFIRNASDVTVRNAIVENNEAHGGGGAFIDSASVTFDNVLFQSNIAQYMTVGGDGAALRMEGGTVALLGCTLAYNHAGDRGGAVYAESGNLLIEDSVIQGNTGRNGGGLRAWQGGSLEIRRSSFLGNITTGQQQRGGGIRSDDQTVLIETSRFIGNQTTDWGGGAYLSGMYPKTISSCLFADNIASFGAGLAVWTGHSVTVINSTFVGNVASVDSAALANVYCDATMTVTNSIFWGNGIGGISGCATTSTVVEYSVVEGGHVGSGNLSSDPLFVSPATGDYHLQVGSPCIDTGTDSGAPSHDLDLANRVDVSGVGIPGAVTDMGAFEYHP